MININDVSFHIGIKTKIAGLAVCLAVAMTAGIGTQSTFANATHVHGLHTVAKNHDLYVDDVYQAILNSTDDYNLDSINGD